MPEENISIKKILLIGFLLLASFILIITIFRWLITGSLTVKSTGTVSVKALDASSQSETIKSASRKLSIKLKPGKYIISASNPKRSLGTSKVVTVKARHSASYVLDPGQVAYPEFVLPADANSLAANGSKLYYVDSHGKLNRLGTSNDIQQAYGGLDHISQASWASANLGVVNNSGTIYLIDGDVIQPLKLPAQPSRDSYVAMSSQGLIVFTSEGNVYAGTKEKPFKLVYESKDKKVRIAAGGQNIALIESSEANEKNYAEGKNIVTLLTPNGKKTSLATEAQQISLSPSGKYLFIAEEDSNDIYNSSLKKVGVLVPTPFGAHSWINDDSFVYATGNQLWVYDIVGGKSSGIATMPNGIRSIALDGDSYAYVASNYSGEPDTGSISRVGLKNQSPPTYLRTLGIFLPERIGLCKISYIAFGKPVITAAYPSQTVTSDFCFNAAKGELITYSINPSVFEYRAIPASD